MNVAVIALLPNMAAGRVQNFRIQDVFSWRRTWQKLFPFGKNGRCCAAPRIAPAGRTEFKECREPLAAVREAEAGVLDISKSDRLGHNLRTLRVERGLTLDRLASMSELTRGYLSLVERGLKTPSIAALLRLAAALGVHVAQLFDLNTVPSPRYTLQRATDVGPATGGAAGLVPLASGRARKAMEPFLIRPPMAGDTKARPIHWAHHDGDEMVFVVSGSIAVKLGSEEMLMEKGDCLYFSGEERHDLRSVGDRQAEVLVVVAVSISSDAPAPEIDKA